MPQQRHIEAEYQHAKLERQRVIDARAHAPRLADEAEVT